MSSNSFHSKELTTGAPLSISAAEVIAQRVSAHTVEPSIPATVAPGVCPFPHGMTVDASVVSMSHEEITASVSAPPPVSVPGQGPVRAALVPSVAQDTVDSTDDQLVEIFESLNDVDSDSGDVDYMALADEVERWLAEEESLRDN